MPHCPPPLLFRNKSPTLRYFILSGRGRDELGLTVGSETDFEALGPGETMIRQTGLTIGTLSAAGLKPVIRPIDEDPLHTDPIKTHWLLNSLIDTTQNRKRCMSYSQSGGLCHVVYGVQKGSVLIKTLAVKCVCSGGDFSAVFYGLTN